MTGRLRAVGCVVLLLGLACHDRQDATLRNEAESPPTVDASPQAQRVRPADGAVSVDRPRKRVGECSKDAEACVRRAVALTRTDLPRAAELFDAACEAGSPAGCGNLGVMLRDGRGVEADPDRARSLLRRACADEHERSCVELEAL